MKNILIGMAVGDALGVPVEFLSRSILDKDPVIGMREYGTHNQPIGTWSDDSSMAFCLTESLIKGWDMNDMANRFVNWFRYGYWTPHGVVFDMGRTTQLSIVRYEQGKLPPTMCGEFEFHSNGNGSLMRILPIIPWFIKNNIDSPILRYKMISDLSSITHGHPISIMSCFILTEFGRELYKLKDTPNKDYVKNNAFVNTKLTISTIISNLPFNHSVLDKVFYKIFKSDLENIDISNIPGDGYCVNTLIASIYCLITTNNYKDATLKAVNLGLDTDTTACVTGGIAGILYGIDSIPEEWVNVLVKKDEIINLAERFELKN